MGRYVLSRKADDDILQIARDSVKQWGLSRAEEYVLGLHRLFDRLTEFPDLGRDAGALRAGYRRIESVGHVVFYRQTESGILIVRVLHARMDFGRHL